MWWSSFTTSGLLSLIVLLFVVGLAKPSHSAINSISCQADRLTVYRVIVHTYWSRERFPKHYPEWRPPAHWSKLVGKAKKKKNERGGGENDLLIRKKKRGKNVVMVV